MKETKALSISVVVCCYNASGRVELTLEALVGQVGCTASDVEIIIVDNSSADLAALSKLVVAWSRLSPVPLRLVSEHTPGLNAARNRGVAEAKGRYICFLDDDAVPVPGWLRALLSEVNKNEADVIGGNLIPLPESGIPVRIDPALYGYWSLRHYGNRDRWLEANEYFLGANIGARRDLLVQRPFVLGVDRVGTSLKGGGELWLGDAAYRRRFVAGATVLHSVSSKRMTDEYLARRIYASYFTDRGVSATILRVAWFSFAFGVLSPLKRLYQNICFRLQVLRRLWTMSR